ncbi:hypothetical protein Rhopal_004159-T1 [Rhodotorula paludigena]|uniref:Xylanolytic transcriptional activator regulatory domain-containing protein n=1 Tax=Rhodotorula paludigena TaxID=86838 RepID=A0AAV5GF18_9BASI|nr:hypothetical protein Rhopal_004159-T1 [Rhodotorula paludigena]
MPPDRTASSSVDSGPYDSPAATATSSPPARSTASLGRGRETQSQSLDTVTCDFDTEEERRKPVGGGKVAALEAKIAALERRLAEVDQSVPGSASPSLNGSGVQSTPPYSCGATAFPPPQAFGPPPPGQYNAFPPPVASTSAHPLAAPYSDAVPFQQFPAPVNGTPMAPQVPPPLPSFPWQPAPRVASFPNVPRLPSYPLLTRLVNAFFDYPHEAIDLVNRRRFLRAFAHPPDHPDYPAVSLLHAMIATATDLAGEEIWEGEETYWGPQGPAEYHADLADVLVPLGFRSEKNILQVAQAAVLFACWNLYHGRFSTAYIDTSVAVRICIALGLNHEGYSSPRDLPLSSFLSHRTFLTAPEDEEALIERSTVWWFASTVETFSAAATGWACCFDERDVTTLLPAAGPYQNDPQARAALYLHHPAFFVTNPPHLVRFVQINLKVTVLMNRVCTFVHRTSSLANATPDRNPLSPEEYPKIRASPAFTKLESALENFGRKAPAQLVSLLEPEAFLCPSLVATSVILLHERFCTSAEGDPSMLKCAEAARQILQNMQVLNSASFHPRQIPPFLTFCWGVAGRTFLRELAILHLRGVYDGADVSHLRASVLSICARLEQTRTPLGPHMAKSLAVSLDHADICLPSAEAALRNPPGVTSIARLTSLLEMANPQGGASAAAP